MRPRLKIQHHLHITPSREQQNWNNSAHSIHWHESSDRKSTGNSIRELERHMCLLKTSVAIETKTRATHSLHLGDWLDRTVAVTMTVDAR